MRSIVLVILLCGIVMVSIGYSRMQFKCSPPRIEYRFVPRSFLEQQFADDPTGAVASLFDSADPFFEAEMRGDASQAPISSTENFFTTDAI